MTTLTHEMVAARAARAGAATAVRWRSTELTYEELDRSANQLAHWIRSRGAGPERVVGLCLDRTPRLAVAMLAVLRAGAAYLPMDPALPRGRREFMIGDAGAELVLTEQLLDRHEDDIAAQPAEPPDVAVRPGNLAYVIYTSGSTGVPKGVLVQHDQLAAYLDWAVPAYLSDGDGAPLHSPVTFDLTVTSLLAPLVSGRTVTMLPVERVPVTDLPAALASGRHSFAKLTPAHLSMMADVMRPEAMAAVRRLVIGGEALTYEHLDAWRANAPDAVVHNEYGPTEAAVGCCVHTFPAGQAGTGSVPIGRATPGTRLVVLDTLMRPVPPGEPGELYIGGAQVTRGYHGRPGLTAQRYVPDPAGGGGRLYRTGDLVRELPGGDLVYIGRRDTQVKLRGYRIELGEVESVLAGHADVAAAAVVLQGQGAGARLVGYLVARAGRTADPDLIRAHAADVLPEYMVPAVLTMIDELPLSSNGKVDRARLPEVRPARPAPAAPSRDTAPYEAEVAEIFTEVLGEPVTVYDATFVALGGTSLQISQVIGQITRRFDVELPPTAWMRTPTVAGFARLVDTYLREGPLAVLASADELDFDLGLDDEILTALTKEGNRAHS